MNINQQSKFKLILLAFLLTVVLIFTGLFLIRDIANKIKNTKAKIAETNRDLAIITNNTQEKNKYITEITKIKSMLPSQYYEVSYFTEQIEALAKNNNLTININIDQNRKEEKENYDSVTYLLEIKGGYTPVSDFLTQISKLPYHTTFDQIDISKIEGSLVSKIKFRLFINK